MTSPAAGSGHESPVDVASEHAARLQASMTTAKAAAPDPRLRKQVSALRNVLLDRTLRRDRSRSPTASSPRESLLRRAAGASLFPSTTLPPNLIDCISVLPITLPPAGSISPAADGRHLAVGNRIQSPVRSVSHPFTEDDAEREERSMMVAP